MTDKELIRKVHSGNKEALSMIAEKYYDDIYRFCRFYTGLETAGIFLFGFSSGT